MPRNNGRTRRNQRRQTALQSIVGRQIHWGEIVLTDAEATDEHGNPVDAKLKLERAQADETNTVARMEHVS